MITIHQFGTTCRNSGEQCVGTSEEHVKDNKYIQKKIGKGKDNGQKSKGEEGACNKIQTAD